MCFDKVSLETLAYIFFILIFREGISDSKCFLISGVRIPENVEFLKCDFLCQMKKELWIRSLWSHKLLKYHPRSRFLPARPTAYWEQGSCTQNVQTNLVCHHLHPSQYDWNCRHQVYSVWFVVWSSLMDDLGRYVCFKGEKDARISFALYLPLS